MNWFKAMLVTFGPRLIASVVGGAATYVATKTSGAVNIDPAQAAIVVTTVLTSYAAAHKAVSSVVNPGDAAKGRVAAAERDASNDGGSVIVDRPH